MLCSPECLACALRQVETTAARVTDDPGTRARLREMAEARAAELGLDMTPAELATVLFHLVLEELGAADPFAAEKDRYNREAMALYPEMRRLIDGSRDRLRTALLLAVAGNLIDLGIMAPMAVNEVIRDVLGKDLALDALAGLRRDLASAGTLLYVADNAGEIAFDRLLIEEIRREFPRLEIAVAVKSGPASNDATRADADTVGLPELAWIVETGGAALGVPERHTSPRFWQEFHGADLVIAKGHANYETLDEAKHPALYFLVTVKCPVVAKTIGVGVGDSVLIKAGSAGGCS